MSIMLIHVGARVDGGSECKGFVLHQNEEKCQFYNSIPILNCYRCREVF